jgi:HEAT repeat protein
MIKRLNRIAAGVLMGLLILIGVVWLLSKTLGNLREPSCAGRSLSYWQQQLEGHDAGASNKAYTVVNAEVVPQLIDTMFHDTNDSKIRLAAIKVLNGLPGIQIYYVESAGRRCGAAVNLGQLGPAAKAAVPALIEALKGKDSGLHEAAIGALGKIRSEPETVIPLLIPYLEDDSLDVPAAGALAEFGGLAKPAVSKLLPLLHAKDDDDRAAAKAALKKIDPIAAAKAGVK